MSIVSGRGLGKGYGAKILFNNVDLTISEGDRVALIGDNGAGKSTLMKIFAGTEKPDSGIIEWRRDAKIVYVPQEPILPVGETAQAVVSAGLKEWYAARQRYETVSQEIAAGDEDKIHEQSELIETIDRLGGWDADHRVEETLTDLGITDPSRIVSIMSEGEKRRVALAAALIAEPALLLLDEPTNHLDADTIAWLEEYLAKSFKGAVLMITHDRYALDAVANRTVELDLGQLFTYRGKYTEFLEQKAERLAHDSRIESNRLNFLRREKEWLSRGPKARTTKQKARIQRAEAVIAVEGPKVKETAELLTFSDRLGNTILDLEDVSVALGGRTLIKELTLRLVAGDRIGVIGKNGVGKTTLLKVVSGELEPSKGKIKRGLRTKFAYFDQNRAQLEDDWPVYDNVAEQKGALETGGFSVAVGSELLSMRQYLERFLFDGHKQRQKVGSLSGGERARVSLAKALKTGANVLLLDEPTNDLDISTLTALEELLESFNGCALIISHDRYFLDRVATSTLVFSEHGQVTLYPGNYSTYRSLRDQVAQPVAKAAPIAPVATKASAPKQKQALTYAERIELSGLLEQISGQEKNVADIEQQLADPALHVKNQKAARELQIQLSESQQKLQQLTERYFILEERSSGG